MIKLIIKNDKAYYQNLLGDVAEYHILICSKCEKIKRIKI